MSENKEEKEFYKTAGEFLNKVFQPFLSANICEKPMFSKHRIYINKYQNGWFITREPLHYEVSGWVAESRENLHKLLDNMIDEIEKEKK